MANQSIYIYICMCVKQILELVQFGLLGLTFQPSYLKVDKRRNDHTNIHLIIFCCYGV